MIKEQIEKNILIAIKAALLGGEDILDVYESKFAVEQKDDKSPLTLADKKANNTIVKFLEQTELPVLSEEGKEIPYAERKNWENYWVVDPLDGTKEFVKRNGEFTVNIALMEGEYPIGGVIFVPVKNQLYFGYEGSKVFFVEPAGSTYSLESIMERGVNLPIKQKRKTYNIVGSRSHMSPETETFIEEQKKKHKLIDIVSMGSSLKICLVADGTADVYPRFAPTMEWDTAAGQAIAEAAGKSVINYETGKRLNYNKENLLNSWFLVGPKV